MDFEISCPHHGTIETLTVPDSYGQHGFEGEVRCADPDDNRPLKIKITAHRATTDPNSAVTSTMDSVERA